MQQSTVNRLYRALALRWELTQDKRWDARHAVSTAPIVEIDGLSVDGNNAEHGVEHRPSPVSYTTRLLDALPTRGTETFIDFGSGLGRLALLAASRYPEVIGVEFAKENVDASNVNIQSFRGELLCDPRIVWQDAATFEVPEDRELVLWFYAPFRPPVFEPVLENLTKSFERNPRRMFVMYCNPFYRELLDAASWLVETPLKPRAGLFKDRDEYVFYAARGFE